MFDKKPAVIFDCNIYIQIVLNSFGIAKRCYDLVDKGEIELFVTQEILEEVAEVLSRPRIKKLVPALTEEMIDEFLADVASKAVVIKNAPKEFEYKRDPDDAIYINLAIIIPADYLISLDKDLLDLMKNQYQESQEFMRRYPFIKVMKPKEFLELIEAQS
jgi:hypothetical protein